MDKNILDFINLAKSKEDFREHLSHAYASEKHIVSLDGHRMHYVDNTWGVRGFLSSGMYKDAQFPNYERLIIDCPERVSVNHRSFTASSWKLLLKELKTFDTVQFTIRNGSVALNAFHGHHAMPWQKWVSPIQKTLSVLMPMDEKLPDSMSHHIRASFLADALSPILQRKNDSSQMALLISWKDNLPIQIRCIVHGISYYSVLMPLANIEQFAKVAA